MNRFRPLVVALAVAALAFGLSACKPTGPRVLILGDSLTIEAKGSGQASFWLADYALDWQGVRYMTSPCNGLQVARNLNYVPDVVVINYGGNRGSFQDNCMAGETGAALAERYRRDTQALIDRFRNGTTEVVVVGAPTRRRSMVDDNLVFDALRAVATDPANAVGWFDGGRWITPDRTQTTRAATCLSLETGDRCGTSQDPRKNYIRDAQHEHLCPLGGKLDGTCAMYSSGAVRLTLNLADGIEAARVAAR